MEQEEKLQIEVVSTIENYDLDFNLGNALMSLVTASYKDNPVDELERAKIFIDRRIRMLNDNTNAGLCVKKDWRK